MASSGREPLLDPRLARTPGFPGGSAIGMVYATGFTGIWVVLALFFQDGLGYSPLRSGLAVTPFALGSAASAILAGRLVPRFGRMLTVAGLLAAVAGVTATAVILAGAGGSGVGWTTAGPLLLAGLGGGMVVSPNTTLTLESVPAGTSGAAGGALQTAQRIGAAIGTALLATAYYHALANSGTDFGSAIRAALLCAAGLMLLALLIAVGDLRRSRRLASAGVRRQAGTSAREGRMQPRASQP